jgi:hypothetical protein
MVPKDPKFYADFGSEGTYRKKCTERRQSRKTVFKKILCPQKNSILGLNFFPAYFKKKNSFRFENQHKPLDLFCSCDRKSASLLEQRGLLGTFFTRKYKIRNTKDENKEKHIFYFGPRNPLQSVKIKLTFENKAEIIAP